MIILEPILIQQEQDQQEQLNEPFEQDLDEQGQIQLFDELRQEGEGQIQFDEPFGQDQDGQLQIQMLDELRQEGEGQIQYRMMVVERATYGN